jgi:hypothetical protein
MKSQIFLVGVLAAGLTVRRWAGMQRFSRRSRVDQDPEYKACPDTTGAVGSKHVVGFADSWFIVHDKATGRIVMQMTISNFWMSVQPSNTLVLVRPNDPASFQLNP